METTQMQAYPPTLESARLSVRRLRDEDRTAITQLRASPRVARYQSWSSFTERDAQAILDESRSGFWRTAGRWRQFAIVDRSTTRMVGDIGLLFPIADPNQAEIGFNIAEGMQRRGFGSEAIRRFLDWLESECGVVRTFAITDERNHASRRLLHVCGFRPAPDGWRMVFFKGEWAGEIVYERLR